MAFNPPPKQTSPYDPLDWELSEVFGATPTPTYKRDPRQPRPGPIRAGAEAGTEGMKANWNYLDAAFQALTGDEKELTESLSRAQYHEQLAGEAMEDLPLWEEFVNEPTAAGFFEQAAIGIGQFFPSAVSSIAAATLVGGVAALTSVSAPVVGGAALATGIMGKQILSKAGLKAAKNILKDAMDKKARKLQMSQAQWDLNEGVYSIAKKMFIGRPGAGRAARFGAYVGAGGQEGTMGTGITFGEFARQGMTGPREALISGAVGVPYAGVGLISEALALRFIFGPLMKEASKRVVRAPLSSGYRNLVNDLSKVGIKGLAKGVVIGGGAGALAEGGAETIQDTMTGLQRLAIDPTYDAAQMKMDVMEAAFKGAVGGFALSGAGRGVTQSARDMLDQVNLRKEKQTDLFGPDLELEKQQRDLVRMRDAIKVLQQDLSIKIPGTDLKTTGAAPEVATPALDPENLEKVKANATKSVGKGLIVTVAMEHVYKPVRKNFGEEGLKAYINQQYDTVKKNIKNSNKTAEVKRKAIEGSEAQRIKVLKIEELDAESTGETVMTFPDLETRQLDFYDMVPDFDAPLAESIGDILGQFAAVLDPDNDKDSVWIPENHPHPSPTELGIIFGDKKLYVEAIPGKGTIYSINSGKVNYVVNNKADDEVLAQVLGMEEAKNASHDRGILVKNKEGRTIHSESTSAHREKAAIDKQKERFNTTEKGKATYTVDEQARHLEDIALERRDALMEEAESGEHITRAIDELANAKSEEAMARMIKRFETNYPVLKALHDSVKNKKDASSVRATKALHDMLLPLLMDTYKTYSEALGEDIDPKILIALTDIAEAAKNLQPKPKTKGVSPSERASQEIEMVQEEQAKKLGAVAVGEEGATGGRGSLAEEEIEAVGAIADAGDFNIIGEMDEGQFNQVTVIGKLGTINQEAEPWQVARPRGDETQQIAGLSQEILATMTADEAATFAANQIMMGGTPFSFPIGLLKAYKEIRAAQPNAILKIRPRYIVKTSRELTEAGKSIFTPFSVLEFFNKNPNLALAMGLKYQELGFVIETTASPEEVLIEYDDKGSKIKGKLTVDQYFERLVVEARRSKPEFKEKSGWTLVSPDGKSEKVDIASMIRGARAIINAEGNYVPGDLQSVYQALTSLFAIADRNGYDFKLGNKSLLKNEFTPKQLLNSKAVVYVSDRAHTLGELLKNNLHNKTQYGDMLGQSAKLVEAIQDKTNLNIEEILSRVNGPEGKNYADFAKLNEEEAENATAIVPETSESERVSIISNYRAKDLYELANKERDPKEKAKLRLEAKTLQRTVNLFAFKDILDGLYQIAIDNGVNVGSYELGYMGVDKETLGVEGKIEDIDVTVIRGPSGMFDKGREHTTSEEMRMMKSRMISDAQAAGMEVSDWYDVPARDMVGNSKYSYVTEYKGRQYSSSSKTNHTSRSKDRKINITQSEAFKKHLGTVNDQFNAVLREFKYFGVSNDIHFMTFEDFANPYSKPSKAQKILNVWHGEEMADNLAKAYWHRRKNAPDGEGLTIRASKNSPWIVVVDTGPLLEAKKGRSAHKINIWSTEEGLYKHLSNLSPNTFKYEGRQYKSVEHAYQSLKSGQFDEVTYNNPRWGTGFVKIQGRKGTDKKTNIALMENIMRSMFDQNTEAMDLLESTMNSTLTHTQDRGIWKEKFPEILMNIRDGREGRFAIPTNVPIKWEKKAKGKAWARYNKKEGVAYIDESELRKRFKNKAWTKPTVKGVKALPEGQFKTVEQWRNFVTRHEFAHAKYPQQEGESKADYENRINQLALAVDERGQDIITETAAIGKVSTALAHELAGHVIIMDILNGVHFKPWRDRLYKEYQKSVDKGYKFSFDEWVSDQAGIQLFHYATHGKFKPAVNAVDSFFIRIAKQILNVWTSIVDGIGRKRMNLAEPNETFGEFWQEVMRLSKEGYAFERVEGKLNHMEQKQIYDMVEQTAKPFNLPPSIWQQVSNKVTEVVQDLQSPGGISRQTHKLLGSAEGFSRREEFGWAGEAAANYFYHKTATITKEGEGLTYPQQTTKDFTMLSNKFGETIEIDERGSVFLGVDETTIMALDLYSNDTITDQQLLDTKKYGEAGKLAHDIRIKFMREYVFFGYLMQKGKEGQPVLPKMKLLESYMIPGDESTRVSFAHREWFLEKIRNEDAVRQGVLDIMIRKIINRTLLGQTKDGKNYVIGPENRKGTKDMAVEEFAQAWAETRLSNILKLPHDNTLAESITAEMEETDTENVDIGFPAALARVFAVQYLPDLDGTLDEDGNPVIKMYGIQNQELKEVGALVNDQDAMIKYLRTATKKFAFEDRGGREYLESLVESLPEHLQPHLRGAIRAQLGKLPAPLDPWFKRINSYGLFVNIVTTLTFAALASFPDLAGPLLRSREMAPFSTAGKEYMNYFQNKQEAIKFAMDLGIVSQDTLATMYINAAEMDYMTLGTKKGTDLFFRMIMLEQFTKFSRVFAANMGRAFILNLAHDTTKDPAVVKRWLRDLGLTKEEVLIWEKTKTVEGEKVQYDFTTPEGKKVSDAIYRFVDESIIRPNAAQRPTWASNPYFALVWQLKGFFYAYGKTIMGGQGREIMNRYNEAGLTPAMLPIAMMALTILPLTALGLELREAIKYGMGGVLPGVSADPSVFRSDDMSVGTYSYEMLDRSGMGGPWGLLFPILSGREYGGPFEKGTSLLGPTSDKVSDLFKYGPFDSRFVKNQIPLYYTLPSEE